MNKKQFDAVDFQRRQRDELSKLYNENKDELRSKIRALESAYSLTSQGKSPELKPENSSSTRKAS